jgi:DNA invertase Pin-like site-specific DNA recombinase
MGTQGRRIDERTRQRAAKLAEQGLSRSEVARVLGMHRETVRNIVLQHRGDRRRPHDPDGSQSR